MVEFTTIEVADLGEVRYFLRPVLVTVKCAVMNENKIILGKIRPSNNFKSKLKYIELYNLVSDVAAVVQTPHSAWSESYVGDAGSDADVPEGGTIVNRSLAVKPEVELHR